MASKRFGGRAALVTGAAGGIGFETARALGAAGARLVLCDVLGDGLEAAAAALAREGAEVALAERVDVADREAMRAFAGRVGRAVGALDVLVNNAGVAHGGSFLDTPLEDWDWLLSINVLGVVHGCHFFVPPMVASGRGGHVVNVASLAGLVAPPKLGAYAASKFAVVGLSESLRLELRPHRVAVSVVCPGLIDTGMHRRARLRGAADLEGARRELDAIYRRRNVSAADVAAQIVRAIGGGRAVVPVAADAWGLYWLKRLSPGALEWLSGALSERFDPLRRRDGERRQVPE
ncbi:MAG TPA: SDR family NAD(P)-dependent oxidoreductase [Polyangiaceae bacterium]|nr:SDR family NAD(P)-dependent oxidoreductase [Polyangiaceae bacterium]